MVRQALITAILALSLIAGSEAVSAEDQVTLASTTSTENSGLLDWLLPQFTQETGIKVRVIAVGTGQAMRLGRNGDADLLMTHARAQEEQFVAEGWGLARRELMYNDFIIAGPADDPAQASTADGATEALRRIAMAGGIFTSRGDDSGTHAKELSLWAAAGVRPDRTAGWYRELGSGMGATLNAAAAMGAYLLVDRATWLSSGNRRGLRVLVEGDPALFNQYAVIVVDPARHLHVRSEAAKILAEWLLGPAGQQGISAFRLAGRRVFFPNASADVQRR